MKRAKENIMLDELYIHNFRGLGNIYLRLGTKMNIFVGVNGAGKSSVLLALSYILSWYVARIRNSKGRGQTIADKEIKKGANEARISVESKGLGNVLLYKQSNTHRAKTEIKSNVQNISQFVNRVMADIEQDAEHATVPVIAYYGVSRSVQDIPLRLHHTSALSQLHAYDNCMDAATNFRSFFEWYREREDLENENMRYADKAQSDPQLETIRRAIGMVLPEYKDLKVQRNPRALVLTKGDLKLNFEQLSDGEKCYLTLIADIARRLAMANPHSENPLEGDGIVLIDEVDLHLHPNWQQTILEALARTFPNIQFFVTTHSPNVVASMPCSSGTSVFRLESGHLLEGSFNNFGQKPNDVLLTTFSMKSLRNDTVQQYIDRIFALLEENDCTSEDYKRHLAWLKEHLDPNDPVFPCINIETIKVRNNLQCEK